MWGSGSWKQTGTRTCKKNLWSVKIEIPNENDEAELGYEMMPLSYPMINFYLYLFFLFIFIPKFKKKIQELCKTNQM